MKENKSNSALAMLGQIHAQNESKSHVLIYLE